MKHRQENYLTKFDIVISSGSMVRLMRWITVFLLRQTHLAFCVVLTLSSTSVEAKSLSPATFKDQLTRTYSHTLYTDPSVCYNFTMGNPHMKEFYSPGYPNVYPNKSDCFLHLKAEYGYFIRVDFRDQFLVEPSPTCEYDFLEIRDGAFGYSPLLGRYCGSKFPPTTMSSDRHLWLRFYSDETIEYTGFRAVYEFIPNAVLERPEIAPCQFDLDGNSGVFSSDNISAELLEYSLKWNVSLDCTWKVRVQLGNFVYLHFVDYKLENPNECEVNFIDVFLHATDLQHRKVHYCGSVAEPVVADDSLIFVRYYVDTRSMDGSKFTVLFTSFRKKEGFCTEDEFDCEDATCIHKSLKCDKFDNCKNHWDEEGCEEEVQVGINFASEHIIIILCIGCFLMGSMIFAMFYNCITKLREDHRSYQESLRRSLANSIDTVKGSVISTPRVQQKRLLRKSRPEEDDTGCYVPEVDLTTMLASPQQSNAAGILVKSPTVENIQMVDTCIQTRDSLAQYRSSRDTSDSPSPPPPPPPPHRRFNPSIGRKTQPPLNSEESPKFGWKVYPSKHPKSGKENPDSSPLLIRKGCPSHDAHSQSSTSLPVTGTPPKQDTNSPKPQKKDKDNRSVPSQRFRAEAVIEMKPVQKPRPTSFESTKSAPDVIVTH